MSQPPRIRVACLEQVRVSPMTIWSFVRIETESGLRGFGEATVSGEQNTSLASIAATKLPLLAGQPASASALGRLSLDEREFTQAALQSAVDMAMHDIEAHAQAAPLHATLGGAQRQKIPLYANINRRTRDRRPQGFAASASIAKAAGYGRFKIAPFDEIRPDLCEAGDFQERLEQGLARIAATRDAIGPESVVRVDCHWRFTPTAAEQLIDACRAFALDWIECPIAESAATIDALVRLRRLANRNAIRLAGLEKATGVGAFAPFLQAGAYDVVMPDVKYLGGLSRFAELAECAAKHGAILSPHNPSGPISHAASLHVAAALPELDSLEMQFDETPSFDALVGGMVSQIENGNADLPDDTGLGVALVPSVVEELRLEPGACEVTDPR